MKKTVFILFCVLSLNLYDFIYAGSLKWFYPFFLLYLLIYILNHKEKQRFGFSFKGNIYWIIASIAVSSILGITYWGQTLTDILKADIPVFAIVCMYFFLKKSALSEEVILKTLLAFTVLWGVIEWLQQLTYPKVYFQGRENIEIRMGLYRFYITGVHFAIIILLYYISKFAKETIDRKKSLFYWAISLISIIGFVSRKQIYASLLCSAIAVLLVKGKARGAIIATMIIAFGIGLSYLSELMSTLNDQTVTELDDDDFIRYISAGYFLYEFSDSALYYLFGTGPAQFSSGIGKVFLDLQEFQHFYRSDCGIVGYFTSYGIIGCVLFILPIVRILFHWKEILLWHKLYLLYFSVMITMSFWGNSYMGLFSFIIFLYSVELNINKRYEHCICSQRV